MKRITKRADQLNPGDILLGLPGFETLDLVPAMILLVDHDPASGVHITFDTGKAPAAWVPRTECDVIEGAYSPAQLHADRLAEFAAEYLRTVNSGESLVGSVTELEELLDLVRPAAPTYAEVLGALEKLADYDDRRHQPVLDILDRARRAGVLS